MRGFTLVEILIVMVIFAIMTATVVLSFGGAASDQELKGMARELALKVELARQEALQRNREWGLYIDRERYVFAEYDDESWIELDHRPFSEVAIPPEVQLEVRAEAFEGEQLEDKKAGLPQVVVFSSGEQTPFEVRLWIDEDRAQWLVASDGLSRTAATLAEQRR